MSSLTTEILGQEVPLNRVNSALRELWRAEDTNKTRASLMNFVIYTEDGEQLDENTQALAELTREHACRAILLLNDGMVKESRAWVTAHCQLYDGKRSVCCEQLSFALGQAGADEVSNIIFSHLESDLPLIVWWQGELGASFDERLYSVMDGLIIDSASWAQPQQSFQALSTTLVDPTTHFALADLAWMRTHSLRNALATACHDSRVLAELHKIQELTVTHAPGARISALIFAAWVGTQLKCTPAGRALRLQRQSGSDIKITLTEGQQGCSLQAAELKGPDITVTVKRTTEAKFLQAIIQQGSHQRKELLPADLQTDASLITEQLSRLGGTSLYQQVLPMLKQWV
jgi:glucose-6-phosphate dehydrogenase assembly protein OpcA